MIPFLEVAVEYSPTPEVSQLTGISIDTLREWSSRRALIEADLRPKSKGSPARYAWQTILILRIAVTLRDRFHVELQASKPLFDAIRAAIQHASVRDLRGKLLALYDSHRWAFIEEGQEILHPNADSILLRLEPHLDVLASSLPWIEAAARPTQIELFPEDQSVMDPADGRKYADRRRRASRASRSKDQAIA
jgi:DNA-binding transcriptional MerR regulator